MDLESESIDLKREKQEKGKKKPKSSSMFVRGIFWGMVFASTAIVSAALGASLVFFRPFLFPSLKPNIRPQKTNSDYTNTNTSSDLLTKTTETNWLSNFKSRLNRPVNILVMGIEPVLNSSREDSEDSQAVFSGSSHTLFLFRADPEEKQLRVLLIPRDTRVRNRKLKIPKIHRANAEGGAELAVEIVRESLNDLPIDGYLRLTTESLRELVDLLGGVELFVPQPMYYGQEAPNLAVNGVNGIDALNLEPGWQTLKGEQAELFARFQDVEDREKGDLARIQRQETLLKALYQRLSNPKVLPQLPQIVDITRQYVDTDLTREEMMALVAFPLQEEVADLQVMLLPGRFSPSRGGRGFDWWPNRRGRDRLLHDFFAGEKTPLYSSYPTPVNRLRIAIENGAEDPELADTVLSHLEAEGFYNAYVTDTDKYALELRRTEILVPSGDVEAAEKLKKVLGVGKIKLSFLGDLDSDLTVRVGEDWLQVLEIKNERSTTENEEGETTDNNEENFEENLD